MRDDKPGGMAPHNFEIGHALTTPFRLPGGRDFLIRLVLWSAAALMLVYAFFGQGLFDSFAQMMALTSSASANDVADPLNDPAMIKAAMSFYGAMAFVGFFSWLVMACAETAMHKNVFRGTDGGLLPIRFGVTEFHVIVTQFVVFLCVMVAYFMGSIITGIFMAIGGMSAIFISALLLLALMGAVGTRFAPSAAIGVREGSLQIGSGLRASKAHFWKMALCYLIIYVVGYFITYIILVAGISFVISAAGLQGAVTGSPDDGAALMNAMGDSLKADGVMLPLVVTVIAYAIANVMMSMFIWGVGNYAAQLDAHNA